MSEIRVNTIKSENGDGNVSFPKGISVTGVTTSTSFSGSLTGNADTATTATTATNAQGLTGTPNITVNNVTGVAATFTGAVVVGGTLSYEDVTNIDAVGIITAQSLVDAQADINVTGIITARAGSAVTFRGGVDVKDAAETVSVGATSHLTINKSVTLELDCSNGTVFTHDLDSGNVGIVSITNFPATKNSFHTVTVLFTQGGSTPTGGIGNTMVVPVSGMPGGIGTYIQLTPKGVTGFATDARVGSATTVTLSGTADDIDVVTFGVHYNGGTNTDANSYRTILTKNGDFRLGNVGV
jgi:hypothetical protein|tara:strand:+ start:773 stop:1663 length:891 start_codon:yes stop_codon:yes gene_type:complete